MSKSETEPQRTNFTEPGSNEYDPNREPLDDSRPTHETASSSGANKDEWIALAILLDGATRYCPRCEEERDISTRLEDKQHEPRECREEGLTPATSLKWTCYVCGYQGFGGIVEDRSIEEFLDVLESVFQSVGGVPDQRRSELKGEAIERKRRGIGDRANLEVLLAEL